MAKRYIATAVSVLFLGRQGENLAREYVFDFSAWKEQYGEGAISLIAQRSGDSAPYPVAIKVEGDEAIWTVTNADTAVVGDGKCELRYTVDEVIVKSATYRTKVMPSMSDELQAPPAPQTGWVTKVLTAREEAVGAADMAKDYANDAERWSGQAQEAQREAEAAAETAAKTAEETAEKTAEETAEKTAKAAVSELAPRIVTSATGEVIAVSDSAKRPLEGLRLFGKTTQNIAPSWRVPVPLISTGDGGIINISIDGEDSQTIAAHTPSGLSGVPVASGGNYTDANGQMWVCDEVDFKRGKYVQRIKKSTVSIIYTATLATGFPIGVFNTPDKLGALSGVLCNKAPESPSPPHQPGYIYANVNNVCFVGDVGDTLETLREKYNGSELFYALATPIERDLTAEEMVQYADFYTNQPTTSVTNDECAGMEILYVSDTKSYIDKKFAELSAAVIAAGTT